MKKYSPSISNQIIFLLFALLITTWSCKKIEPEVNEENEELYNALKQWYLWNEEMPSIDPSLYTDLQSIIRDIRHPLDRWSMITEWGPFYAYISNSEFIGYGFGSKWDNEGKLRVSFVFNSVEMYQQGVRRTWILDAVNGTPVTPTSNLGQMLGPDQVGVSNNFRFINPEGNVVNMTVAKQSVIMNTVLHHEIIEAGNLKVGYLVLQGFTGTTSNELKPVFEQFKQQQIDELVLDLRYNGGGLVSTARELASLIGGAEVAGQAFVRFEHNNILGPQRNRVENFSNEENSLNLNRLFVIASPSTASASELVINGLDPHLEVFVVGTQTLGKPVGSNILQFNEIWALVPITFRTLNSRNEGNYYNGLPADILAGDGLSRPFGDPEEESLKQALLFILTGSAKSDPTVPVIHGPAFFEKEQWRITIIDEMD